MADRRSKNPLPANVRALAERQEAANDPTTSRKGAGRPAVTVTRAAITWASEVKAKPVRWLWRNRIVAGDINVIFGPGKRGKGTVAAAVAAAVAGGPPMPGEAPCEPGRALIVAGEDARAQVLVPRLRAAGANMGMVGFLDVRVPDEQAPGEELDVLPQLLQHFALLEQLVKEQQIRLLVIDPIASFLDSGIDSHNDADVRRVLSRLSKLAERHSLTVLLVAHTRKGDGPANQRMSGSVGFYNAARSVLVVEKDPEDEDGRVLAVADCNLGEPAPSLRFRLASRVFEYEGEEDVHTSKVVWGEECEIGADELLAAASARSREGGRPPAKREGAEDFLRDLLAAGPVEAAKVLAAAGRAGVADRTLTRASKDLGVEIRKQPGQPNGPWIWRLPPRGSGILATFDVSGSSDPKKGQSNGAVGEEIEDGQNLLAIFEDGQNLPGAPKRDEEAL